MDINPRHEAKLLLYIDEIAKDIGLDAVSSKYFEMLDELVESTFEELTKIWQVEGES